MAVRIDEVAEDASAVAIIPHDATPGEGGGVGGSAVGTRIIGDARLDIAPAVIVTPRLNGPNVIRVTSNHGLTEGETIGWLTSGAQNFARIQAVDINAIELENPTLPAAGTRLYRARTISRIQFTAAGNNWLLPLESELPKSRDFAFTFVQPDGSFAAPRKIEATTTADFLFDQGDTEATEPSAIKITVSEAASANEIFFFDAGRDDSPAGVLSNLPPRFIEVNGNAGGFAGGMLVALAGDDNKLEALRIQYVLQFSDRSFIRFTTAPTLDVITTIHGDFAARIAPTGYDRDPTPIGTTTLALDSRDIAEWPKRLGPGRRVVLESESGTVAAISTIVADVDADSGEIILEADAAALAAFTVGDLIVRGNVVLAGHGEIKPGKIVGSGDASIGNQSFTLAIEDLTHVSDPVFPGGIRAAVDVEIDGQIWQQMPSLRDAFAADPAYTARLDADTNLQLRFGDGFNGAQTLPTGRNNVLVHYRRGAGLGGNLEPFALAKIVNAHPALTDIRQPVEASGGDEREALESIRDNAAERLAALDRAVSLADFAALASAVQGVWHARARETPPAPGRRRGVIVTVVPAGGGALGIVGDRVAATLATKSIPGVDIGIEPFRADRAVGKHYPEYRYRSLRSGASRRRCARRCGSRIRSEAARARTTGLPLGTLCHRGERRRRLQHHRYAVPRDSTGRQPIRLQRSRAATTTASGRSRRPTHRLSMRSIPAPSRSQRRRRRYERFHPRCAALPPVAGGLPRARRGHARATRCGAPFEALVRRARRACSTPCAARWNSFTRITSRKARTTDPRRTGSCPISARWSAHARLRPLPMASARKSPRPFSGASARARWRPSRALWKPSRKPKARCMRASSG